VDNSEILTSKPSAIKILQTLFANPAPRKLFQGMGGGGLPSESMGFPISASSLNAIPRSFFAGRNPQARIGNRHPAACTFNLCGFCGRLYAAC
jgi:hypothetical protein